MTDRLLGKHKNRFEIEKGNEAKIVMSKILIGLITHPKTSANPTLYKESMEYFVIGFQGGGMSGV